ncbi:rod shape-determining protein MreC [Sphingomonas sp. AOB5]|uniref:rod shape-determining protein MreC n=1 Tax=Sphingomonas sp. AOB5 TaxID=3034017 RepID=UPI003211CE8B
MGTVAGAVIAAGLLLLSTFNPPVFAAVRGFFAEITTPISSAFAWASSGIANTPQGIAEHFNVRAENERLRKQLADNETLVGRARTLNQENRRLRELLKVRDVTTDAVVTARLVNSSASSTRRYATLNAGSWQHVKRGQPVREAAGLIGQVIEVSPNTSRVLLIIDPDSNVPVRRTRDGMPAIAKGRGDGLLDIRSAGLSSMVFQPGDVFVTSGTGGIFPPNIAVARVISNQRDSAIAEPAANPDALDFALVMQAFLPEPPPAPSPTPAPKAAPKK